MFSSLMTSSGLFSPHGPMNGAFCSSVRPGQRRLRAAAIEGGWRVVTIDGRRTPSKAALLAEIARVLRFPDWFGHNWDALADCLEDDEWMDKNGVVILWQGAEQFRKAHHEEFETALDIFSEAAEYWQEHKKPFWLFLAA